MSHSPLCLVSARRLGAVLFSLAVLATLVGCSGSGSMASVRQLEAGNVVIRQVMGEDLHADGYPVSVDLDVNLPSMTTPTRESAPATALLAGRIFVARAIVDGGATTIHVVGSDYASTLYAAEPVTAFDLPYAIDSRVHLTVLDGELLLAFHEGDVVKASTSSDGVTWSAVFDLVSVPAGSPFAFCHDGTETAIAIGTAAGVDVQTTTDGTRWTTLPGPLAGLTDAPRDVSIAYYASAYTIAYCDADTVAVAREKDGTFGLPTAVATISPFGRGEEMLSVSIFPSVHGWALAFVQERPTNMGDEFTRYRLESDDGVSFPGPAVEVETTSSDLGCEEMAMTPGPMPWITKTHDSGRPHEEVYDFIITCDGFTYGERSEYMTAAREMTRNIVDRAPFCFHQDKFNVWVVNTVSKSTGFDTDSVTDDKNTVLDGYRVSASVVRARLDAMIHARRLIAGIPMINDFYGFLMFNPPEGEVVGSLHADTGGIAFPLEDSRSKVVLHEFFHSNMGAGGFVLGDHDRRLQAQWNNKSFDDTFVPGGTHDWQPWFVFTGTAPSRQIRTSVEYRDGLVDWVAAGNPAINYYTSHFAYSEDPDSPYYVDALSLFNPGLWESERTGVDDLDEELQFMALRSCLMNSQIHHFSQQLCPICSQVVVEHLFDLAGETFGLAGFQSAPGAFLEFQVQNTDPAGGVTAPAPSPLALDGLVEVDGVAIDPDDITTFPSVDSFEFVLARVDISSLVTAGVPATVTFNGSPASGDTRVWLPSVQVLNGEGARYPMHPVGEALIDRLHEKHAPETDYEYWDLTEGDLVIEFVPN